MPFVKRYRTYYKYGTEPNATIVGSPTIVDGVASGFSTSNYLTTLYVFPSNTSSFEMVICFKSSNISSTADIAGSTSSANNNKVPEFRLSGSKLNIYQDTAVSLTGTTTLLSNTWHWARLSFDGSEYKLELSTDGITYTTEATKSSTSKNAGGVPFSLGLGYGDSSAVPFTNGSIDFTQSYIKINDKMWWHGTKAIESTEDDADYYIDSNKLYQLAAVKRSYWKYVWEDYSLPKMTSNTTPEGKLTYDIGIDGPYATDIYPVFFGGSSNINGLYNQATRYLRYTFAKILKAGKYTFTYAAYRQNNVTNNLNKWEAILEDDSRVEIMNPTITTSTQTFTAEFEVDKPIKAINLTLYASAPAEASCYYVISKIALTGEGLAENTVKAAEIVAGTSSDYDYYTDKLLSYEPYAPKLERYSETFTASSDIQTFTVPEGITKLNIVCAASKGYGSTGGGGKVICDLAVTEGQNLYIVVGGIPNGYATSSYNASDIRLDNTGITDTTSLQSRIIVAGGAGNQASRGAAGGAGGGLTGANGGTGYGGDSQGKGGTQTSGGAGGAGTPVSVGHYHNGEDGTFGLGGAGNIDDSYEGRSGAGGAGYYGGGSGASDWNKNGAYTAGGGGGSSYTDDTLCSNVTHLQGSNSGEGYVTIKYVKELIK